MIFAVIWFFAYAFSRPQIEANLTKLTEEKLERFHYNDLEVSFNGRDASISGTVKSDARKSDVPFLIDSIYGVENVDVDGISTVRVKSSDLSTTQIGVLANSTNLLSGWIYLAIQIFILLGITLLLGFLLGWVQAFGRSRERGQSSSTVAISFHREQIARLEEEVANEAYRAAALDRRIEGYHTENLRLQSEIGKREQEVAAEPERKADPKENELATSSPDDLQILKGVGVVLARRLNEAGIHNFQQISEWTAKDRRFYIGKIKGLEGNLKRYDLISQAWKLVKKK